RLRGRPDPILTPAATPGPTRRTHSPPRAAGRDNRPMAKAITPREASYRLAQGAILVDVREDHERELGMAQGALGVARATLEAAPHEYLPAADADSVLHCQSGGRSMPAAG